MSDPSVPLPSFVQHRGSPAMAGGFVGVAIRASREIRADEPDPLKVYGGFQIPVEEAKRLPSGDPFQALVLLLIHSETATSGCGKVLGNAILIEPAPSPKGVVRGFFNVDAFAVVKLPPRAGSYVVSAYLDRYRSDAVATKAVWRTADDPQPCPEPDGSSEQPGD
jgi:hypothetical protein